MVLIWKGKGWQVIVVTFLSSLVAELLTRFITKKDNYYGEQPLPIALSFLCSSLILYLIVRQLKRLNHVSNDLLDFDEESSNSYKKNDHTFFFIPMEYWVIIDLFFSIFMFFERSGYF